MRPCLHYVHAVTFGGRGSEIHVNMLMNTVYWATKMGGMYVCILIQCCACIAVIHMLYTRKRDMVITNHAMMSTLVVC